MELLRYLLIFWFTAGICAMTIVVSSPRLKKKVLVVARFVHKDSMDKAARTFGTTIDEVKKRDPGILTDKRALQMLCAAFLVFGPFSYLILIAASYWPD